MIFYFSSQPGDPSAINEVWGLDKVLHGLAYAALAVSTLIAAQPLQAKLSRSGLIAGVVLFCILAGIGDEFHQSFVPLRVVDGWDVAADGVGAAVVVLLWLVHGERDRGR